MSEPRLIRSRENPVLARLRRLGRDGSAYRRGGEVWLEGDHLCAALRARQRPAALALIAESAWAADAALRELAQWASEVARVDDALFAGVSTLESPARIGFLIQAPEPAAIDPGAATVVLDRLQDTGNVGSILRSAAALGVRQVLALKGTAALWSPKVLRAGMGAHFALALAESLDDNALEALHIPLVATSSHGGAALGASPLPRPCAWVFGHEGQGVSPALLARCALQLRIPQPGGEESLNVAAAAAICLYESARAAQ
ncbi:MAG: RNA methyltransferase [Burkholderiales bacterium]|nr:RNA methyltransferase [Burkholderiales bacterium]MDE2395537.1 RNA methyltransferase [Burkholderiales bacterium]MDE2452508.1 RNA methyltransferase [Burkholderiales bacterium]